MVCIYFQTISFKKNPYIFGTSNLGSLLSSNVLDVTMTDQNNQPVTVDTITVSQPTPNAIPTYVRPSYAPGDPSKLFYHHLLYRNNVDNFCTHIYQQNKKIKSYDAFVRQGTYPSHLYYDVRGRLSESTKWKVCFPSKQFKGKGQIYVGLRPHVTSGKLFLFYHFCAKYSDFIG